MDIPQIDPKVRFAGVSRLRELNTNALREMRDRGEALVIQDGEQPLMVMVSYEAFIEMQTRLRASYEME